MCMSACQGAAAIGLMNRLVAYLPHLLALSASSPFWQGVDTDLLRRGPFYFGRPSRPGYRLTSQAGLIFVTTIV